MKYALAILVLLLTAPAWGAPPTTAPAPPRVLVLPFAPVDAADRDDRIGRGVQQSIAADLTRGGAFEAVTAADFAPSGGYETDAAIVLGQARHATYVVFGTYQIAGNELRVTGSALADGRTVGGLKVTGTFDDLFGLQDELGRKVVAALQGGDRVKIAPLRIAAKRVRSDLARDVGPVAIHGFRAPTPYMSAETASKIKLQNANPYDYFSPYGYYNYWGGWGWWGGYYPWTSYYTPLGNYNYEGYEPVWGSLRGGYPYGR